MSAKDTDSSINRLLSLSKAELPSHDELFEVLVRVTDLFENSNVSYRVRAGDGGTGGLLDFRNCFSVHGPEGKKSQDQGIQSSTDNMPLLIVPDLHARFYFFKNILNFVLPEDFVCDREGLPLTVLDALQKRLLRVVCVGDGLHSESRGKERWLSAWKDFCNGKNAGSAMKEEMAEGLSLMRLVMECKCAFPEVFHFLKGNHENIESLESDGDFPFRKFVEESLMTRRFIVEYYGDDILYLYSCFEKDLPLAALFDNCIVSHAEPARAFSYNELVEGRNNPEVVKGLIWTNNGEAQKFSAEKMLEDFTCGLSEQKSYYFAGHRPVTGRYRMEEGRRFVQIHNPNRQNVVLVYPERTFNPETDIVSVI